MLLKLLLLYLLSVRYLLNATLSIIKNLYNNLGKRLRFSIAFKMTVIYTFIFSIILFLFTNGILFGFRHFLISQAVSDVKMITYLRTLFIILIIADLISLLTLIILSSKTSKKMLAPVEEMTRTVKKISVDAFDTRLNVSGSKDELKDLAETFNDMIDRIQKSYELQNQFVSDASHELRTPIAVIQGYANLLDRWGKDDKSVLEESITAIKSESENMKNLVENLLFLARGDKNTQKVEFQEFLLNELINEIIKETRLIDDKHTIICRDNFEIKINADRKLLKEALRIFIHNSVKFTPPSGTIELRTELKKRNINIVVEDTGVGISKEDLPYIFNRFYAADKSRTKNAGGNGLGLSIAKWIIEKHNGKIDVESILGKGTKITVCLPIKV